MTKFLNEHGDTHASSSHEVSLEPTFRRREDLSTHEAKFVDVKKASQRTADLKRKAAEAHEKHVHTENVAGESPMSTPDLRQL